MVLKPKPVQAQEEDLNFHEFLHPQMHRFNKGVACNDSDSHLSVGIMKRVGKAKKVTTKNWPPFKCLDHELSSSNWLRLLSQ